MKIFPESLTAMPKGSKKDPGNPLADPNPVVAIPKPNRFVATPVLGFTE